MDLIKQIKEAADKKNFEDLHSNDQSSLTAMALTVKEKEKHIANLEEQLKKGDL